MGLNRSIWAYPRTQILYSNGDWTCTICHAWNYYWRNKCENCHNFCSFLKQNIAISTASTKLQSLATPRKQQISSHKCSVPRRSIATTYEHPKPPSNPQNNQEATRQVTLNSDWSYEIKQLEEPPICIDSTYRKRNTRATNKLGLPYQVQHYVLSLMEKMLEEACYDFALRWIPQKLIKWGWDCAEATELAKWRSILPYEIPQHALKSNPNYSLSRGLANAVKIRNAVAHRHVCDNCTIKVMAWHAEQLLFLFSDNTRKEKFYDLCLEIDKWEKNLDNLDVARLNLEHALQRITEHPLDDMDWTPSIIILKGNSTENELPAQTCHMGDMMDLDYF